MNPEEGPRLRPRFKGIENFLRRIAFNLGNTPSQTEVKVISCVPIDVTDLQNKIVELEKELDSRSTAGRTVNTALGVPLFTPQPLPPLLETPRDDDSTPNQESSSSTSTPENPVKTYSSEIRLRQRETPKAKRRRPRENVQMVYYAETTTNASPFKNNVKFERKRKNVVINKEHMPPELDLPESYMAEMLRRQYAAAEPSSSSFSWPMCRDEQAPPPARQDFDVCSCCHAGFQDLDHSVDSTFPALRECNHYYDSSMYDLVPVRDTPICVIEEGDEEKYYLDPGTAVRSPRERSPAKTSRPSGLKPPTQTVMYASVAHRPAYKLRYKTKMPPKSTFKRDQVLKTMQRRKADPRLGAEASRTSCVELGDLYAKIVPRAPSLPPPSGPAPSLPLSPQPSQAPSPPPPPPRLPVELKNAECLTASVHDSVCQTATSRSVQLETPSSDITKTEITLNQIKSILHAVLTEVKTNSIKSSAEDRPMKDAVVQNGQSHSNIPHCPTGTGAADDRTNFMAHSIVYPYNMNPYSPFTGNPCYASGVEGAAPGAMPTGPYGPPKGLQQYPLFIQAPARCTCCYRSMPQRVPSPLPQPQPPPRVSAESVDNSKQSRNRETDNLVKEIYKSLYMDYARPTTSSKSHSQNVAPVFKLSKLPKSSKSEAPAPRDAKLMREPSLESRSRLFGQKAQEIQQSSSLSYTESLTPSEPPTPVRGVSSSDTNRPRALPPQFLLEPQEPYTATSATTPIEEEDEEEEEEAEEEEESESISTDETASDRTVMPRPRGPELLIQQQAKEKKVGLFSKMKQLFTTKHRRRPRSIADRRLKKVDHQKSDRQEQSSDDDYETVYSDAQARPDRRDHRIQPPHVPRYPHVSPTPRPRYPSQTVASRRGRTHSKVSRSRNNISRNASRAAQHSRRREEPYVEQDYRRYWGKQQAYQMSAPTAPRYPAAERGGRGGRGARARYGGRETVSTRPRQHPPFWQEYEARTLLAPSAPARFPPPAYRPEQVNNARWPQRPPMPLERPAMPPKRPENPGASKGKGLSWLKKALPTMPQITIPQCGVQWKDLVMNN